MTFSFLLAALTPTFAASMMFKWAFIDFKNNLSLNMMCATLGLGLGLGMASCTFFLWRISNTTSTTFQLMETSFFVLLGVTFFLLKRRASTSLVSSDEKLGDESNLSRRAWITLDTAFCGVLITAIAAFLMASLIEPHGGWDAQAIWNLRARCLFRSGEQWGDCFSPLILWSHPDYPLLIPAILSRFWFYLGLETVFVPILVAGFFTFGTVTLIASVFSVIQRKSQGILAGLFLLGTGFFIRHGWSQYADVPLCFFILSTVIVLMLKDRISLGNNGLTVMAGLMASMAAWTKNEGLLFVVAVVVARSVLFIYFRQFRKYLNELIFFLLGLIPVMVVLALFKLSYAPSGDELFLQPLSGIVLHLFDIARYTYLGNAFAKEMMHFGNNIVGLLLIYVYFVKLEINELNRPTIITVASILIIMLMGYFLVYILSPYDLKWHLSSSLERLLLQLWPVFLVFVFFVTKPFYFTRQNEK
jgi:hypothetical protein